MAMLCLTSFLACLVAALLAVVLLGPHLEVQSYGTQAASAPQVTTGDLGGNAPDEQVVRAQLVEVDGQAGDGSRWRLCLDAVAPGATCVSIQWSQTVTEDHQVEVLPFNVIVCDGKVSGGFACVALACLWVVFVCAACVRQSVLLVRENLCSHRTISSLSVSVLCALVAALLLLNLCALYSAGPALEPYLVVQAVGIAPSLLAMVTFPLLAAILLVVCASNVMLVRREGLGPRNMLGVAFMAFFAVALLFIEVFPVTSGSEPMVKAWSAISGAAGVFFGYVEVLLVCTSACAFVAARRLPTPDRDCVIVLGCGLLKDGTPTPLLRARCDGAAALYRVQDEAGRAPLVICSGGKGTDELCSEAASMATYLVGQGIPRSALVLEDRSVNTYENMRNSIALAQEATGKAAGELKMAYSTTNYHVFRAAILAQECGFRAQGIGCPTKWYFWPNAFLREFVGFMAVKWRAHAVACALAVAVAVAAVFVV